MTDEISYRTYLAIGIHNDILTQTAICDLATTREVYGAVSARGDDQIQLVLSGHNGLIDQFITAFFAQEFSQNVSRFIRMADAPLGPVGRFTVAASGDEISPKYIENQTSVYDFVQKNLAYINRSATAQNRYKDKFTPKGLGIPRAAEALNLPAVMLGNRPPLMQLFSNQKRVYGLIATASSDIPTVNRIIADDKTLTKIVAAAHGLLVPSSKEFTELSGAVAYFLETGMQPCVLKPSRGSYGNGITVDVTDLDRFVEAWRYAQSFNEGGKIMVEEFVEGVDLRILVFNGKAHAAMFRVPANVVGDGVSSIEKLVGLKNKSRRANPRTRGVTLELSPTSIAFLASNGFKPTSVPVKGQLVLLIGNANISAGGDNISVNDIVHPSILTLAEKCAVAFGLQDYCGVDVVTKDITKSVSVGQSRMIEINARAEFGGPTYPIFGPAIDAPALILQKFAEQAPVLNKTVSVSLECIYRADDIQSVFAFATSVVAPSDGVAIACEGQTVTLQGVHKSVFKFIAKLAQQLLTQGETVSPYYMAHMGFEMPALQKPVLERFPNSEKTYENFIYDGFAQLGWQIEDHGPYAIISKGSRRGVVASSINRNFGTALLRGARWRELYMALSLAGIPQPSFRAFDKANQADIELFFWARRGDVFAFPPKRKANLKGVGSVNRLRKLFRLNDSLTLVDIPKGDTIDLVIFEGAVLSATRRQEPLNMNDIDDTVLSLAASAMASLPGVRLAELSILPASDPPENNLRTPVLNAIRPVSNDIVNSLGSAKFIASNWLDNGEVFWLTI
jgi:D-alanine-D-alanine ligase-like ATP-grasp enzyme